MTIKKPQMNKKIVAWLAAATPRHKSLLAEYAGTSRNMFRQWARGVRLPSADMAGRVELGTQTIAIAENGPAPLSRADLCAACAKCPYYKSFESDVDDLK